MLTVGIVSGCALTRRLLQAFLSSTGEFQVPVIVSQVLGNTELLKKHSLDVLIIDSADPNEDLAILRQTKKLIPEIKIAMLVPREDHKLSLIVIEAGGHGCLSKDREAEILLKALRHIAGGEFWIKREVASMMAGIWARSNDPQSHTADEMTKRELDILALLALGSVNKDIAARLSISENTVKAHLASVYRKMGVSTRLEAVLGYHQRLQKQSADPATAGPSLAKLVPATPEAAEVAEDLACLQASLSETNPRLKVRLQHEQKEDLDILEGVVTS